MSNVKNDFIMPIVVLTAICIVITTALAFTEQATTPIIEAAAKAAAEAARLEVLPAADGFDELSVEGMPTSVKEMYSATNGSGTVIICESQGYGGAMKIIVGIDTDGNITGTKTLSHAETAGLGSKTADAKFQSLFMGKDSTLAGVDAIGGATISSNCFISMVQDAFAAQQSVTGGGSYENPLGVTEAKLAKYYPDATFTTVEGGIKASTGGTVVFATVKGLQGDIVFATLFDENDTVIGIIVDSWVETAGIANPLLEESYTGQFLGKTSSEGIDFVAGATETGKAMSKAFDETIANLSKVKGA